MGWLDFFRKGNAATDGYRVLFDAIAAEASAETRKGNYSLKYNSLHQVKSLSERSNEFKTGFLFYLCERVLVKHNEYGFNTIPVVLRQVSLNEEQLCELGNYAKRFRENGINEYYSPAPLMLKKIEEYLSGNPLTPAIQNALRQFLIGGTIYTSAEYKRMHNKALQLMDGTESVVINRRDRWGKAVLEYVNNTDKDLAQKWTAVFSQAKLSGSKSSPTQKWVKEMRPKVDGLGHEEFSSRMIQWLGLMKEILQEGHKSTDYNFLVIHEDNHEVLKALIWCLGFINDPSVHTTLDDYAVWAYKKKSGVGSLSAKTGTAAMFAFSLLPVKEGVSRISKFRKKIKNQTILKSINKILRTLASERDISIEEMEEISLPSFNIMERKLRTSLGHCTAVYSVEDDELKFEVGGKLQKTLPVDVKAQFPKEIKLLKDQIKEIKSLIPVIANRLERGYLAQQHWDYKTWRERYLDHPLGSMVARKLVWHFSQGEQKAQAFFHNGIFVDAEGNEVGWVNDDRVKVELWHPIGFESGYILLWRNFMRDRGIVQPFKQAFREVYILTDAELRTDIYSNRFAAHVLRQHIFLALCKQRGWKYTIQGNWDSHNTPTLELPHYGLFAQFFVEPVTDDTNDMGIFNFISSDQVRFGRNGLAIHLYDVPALVFSEVLRDVDLFVGVTSIGADPTWTDNGNEFQNRYWHEYSFQDLSESAVIRSQVLQSVIPQLKIAPQCSFDKKFLIVRGKRRTYRIHMGSGNILMEPNDQYLCIVPAGRSGKADKVFLPFEGDNLLSIIISKAMMLAADDKITDSTILRQINSTLI